MPKLRMNTNLTDLKHSEFKVLGVERIGYGLYHVNWSAKFGGVKHSDQLSLYADDELDAFQLAMRAYGGNGDGR